MRIGFDLDGVIAKTDIALFRIADRLGSEVAQDVYHWKFKINDLLLNPIDFLLYGEDEYYIITSRTNHAKGITKQWVEMYCPHCKELIIVDSGLPDKNAGKEEILKWLDRMAIDKADILNNYKIDVYFEDSPLIVKKLRELCPNTKIMQYGGRLQ